MADVKVVAESSGTVARIEAEVGAKVGADDTILIVEAMKMEIPIEAGVAGTVKEILVEAGDAVEEGDDVAIIAT